MKKASAKLKRKVKTKFVRAIIRAEAQEMARERVMRNRRNKKKA